MIPSLVVPVLNRPDLLGAMLRSVDHPVRRATVIDNGGVVPEGTFARHVHVVRPGWNLGVAASWNLGVKCDPLADWWLVANSDVQFGPGDLARLAAAVNPSARALYLMPDFSAFAWTRGAIKAAGWFDENFHPAYDEDVDYRRRCALAGVDVVCLPWTGSHDRSATIRSDPEANRRNGETHPSNDAYYRAKWGAPKGHPGGFPTPFDGGGPASSWTLDPDRLRWNAW